MRTRLLFIVAAMIVVLALRSPAFAQGPNNCQPFAGSLAARVVVLEVVPGTPPTVVVGWSGTAFVTIGGAAPVTTGFVALHLERDRPQAPNQKGLWGGEKYIFDFGDGNTLQMEVDYVGMFTPAPFLGQYNASGKVVPGTGVYAQASGNVTAHGPFVATPPDVNPPFTSWIAELKGTVCGGQ